MRLSAIEVENFQSFTDRQRVEFGPLTLFFGPNSAGKSAIADAYTLITTYLFDRSTTRNDDLNDMITRWAHLHRTKGHKPKKYKTLSITAEFKLPDTRVYAMDQYNLGLSYNSKETIRQFLKDQIIRVDLTFLSRDFASTARSNYLQELKISIGDHPFQLLKSIDDKYHNEFIKRLYCVGPIDDKPAKSQLTDGRLQDYVNNLKHESIGQQEYGYLERNLMLGDSLDYPAELMKSSSQSASDFHSLWNAWLEFVLEKQRGIFDDSPPIVEGDRGLIEDSLLTVDLNLSWDDYHPEKNFNHKNLTEYWIKTLATCAYASLIRKAQTVKGWSNLVSYGGVNHTGRGVVGGLARRLEQVNAYLENSLFTDKLYSVSCSASLAVDVDLSKNPIHKRNRIGNEAQVTLKLLDANSNELSIKDVGSGIPYCLPWLTAITAQGTIWVQQPELHLHPALQTRVGDVLISALAERSTAKSIVVETHSEHIILRLLRRIRETTNNPESQFALKYDEIEVYYFDPEVNSGTTIKRLPVTEAGEFYLPWPNGFFRERDEDLWHGE